jgi:hypothetical protein
MRLAVLLIVTTITTILLGGCSPVCCVNAPADQDVQIGSFEREVSPFPVTGPDGAPIDHPFLGGLNVPRPQLVDIDQDGDDDLFLQENTDELRFFERTDSGELVWRTDRYQELAIGDWFRFADLDGDGDPDLLAESPYSYIRLYENTGSPGNPSFTLVSDTLRAPDGTAIFSDRQNIPTVADVDCNDRLDLFIGRLDGTLDRYEATEASTPGEMPTFALETERFEDIEIVNQIGSLHGANTLAFADPDDDGDLDLFWGDFFEPGLLLIENRGPACSRPDLRTAPKPFPPSDPMSTSGYNAPSLGDADGDGDTDLLVGVLGGAYDATTTLTNNLYFYERSGPDYALATKRYVGGIDVGNESTVAAGDIDGDGDLDLLLSNKIEPSTGISSRVRILENTGSATEPAFRMRGAIDLPDTYHYAPALGDLDGDGDPDLVLGTWDGDVLYVENDNGAFVPAQDGSTVIASLPRGSNATPTLGDIDGDGDLDLLVGEASGTVNVFRNDGSPTEPNFVLQSETIDGVKADARSAPHLTDLDGDGRLDLLLGSSLGGIQAFARKDGAEPIAFAPADPLRIDAPKLVTPIRIDLNGDGLPDLVTGSDGGGLLFWKGQ